MGSGKARRRSSWGTRATIPAVKQVLAAAGKRPAVVMEDFGVVLQDGLSFHRGEVPGTVEVRWEGARGEIDRGELEEAARILRAAGYVVKGVEETVGRGRNERRVYWLQVSY